MKFSSSLLARGLLAASLILATARLQALENSAADPESQPAAQEQPCRWWQFGKCDSQQQHIEGLPDGAPHTGTVITVDLTKNRLYLFEDAQLIDSATVATASDKILRKRDRVWLFYTPRGRHQILRKVVDPVWTKPDWAFVEEGEPIPPPDSPARKVRGKLGKYALHLGGGIMIHGTDDPSSIGRRVTHGCIRVPGKTLATVYKAAQIGTPVYIFESAPPRETARNGEPERHSDLDYLEAGRVR